MTGYRDTVTDVELWTVDDAAEFCGVSVSTWRAYVARGRAPAPDRTYGRTPLWFPETIREWQSQRRGQGWRAGAKG